MNLIELDFQRAKARHLLYKTRLKSILYGADIDQATVLSRLECLLCQWIYNHAIEKYSQLPETRDLEAVHRTVHEAAGRLLHLYNSGQAAEAREGLADVEMIASSFDNLLLILEHKVKGEGIVAVESNLSEELGKNYNELLEVNTFLQNLNDRIKIQAEESLEAKKQAKDSESRFRDTMMQAPVGITILRGEDLMVEMANSSYLEIVDKSEADFVGKPLFDSLPEIRETIEPILLEVLRSGAPYRGNEFETIIKRFGKNETCYFNFIYQPLIEKNGQSDGIIVVATEVTQQVKTKQALESSEIQFRNLVTQSPFAKAVLKGRDLVISIANESLLKTLWRRELHEVEGKRLLDVFPELKGQKFPEILQDVYNTGKIYKENEAVAFIHGPDGTKRHYLDYQYAPIFEVDRSVSGIMISVNDVTEKVESRQYIADAADRLTLATEGTQLATWDLDLQTRSIIYSSRLAQIFGYDSSQKLTHQDLRDHIHPEDVHNVVESAFKTALKTGVYYYEARVIHPDGAVRWVRTQGKVLFSSQHVPLRMLGTMMDITEKKEAELALRTSEGKFRTLADSMPQFVWTGDVRGNINYFNKSVYDYSGLSPEQIKQEGWLQIVHPDDKEQNIRLWNEAITNGTNFLCEHRFRRSDGEYRWQLSRAIPQKDANGDIQMWVGTSTDIHDSKLFIDQLGAQVQLRTQELTVANDELIKTNMELAQFAYVASHDLQEPLRKIQTFATRIMETERENLSPRGKDYFNRMQASSTRMQQLIVDLLAFSRANAVEKHFEKTDLNVILNTVKEQLAETILQKNAVIISTELPTLSVITYQFEQLFTNLIANSLKFTSAGVSPVIEISAGKIAGNKIKLPEMNRDTDYHYISFKDNGIGFEEEFKERIFQVFQRLHNRNAYEGTGIGLAICKKIIENHHGMIDAQSELGKGATFTIYIPADPTTF